MRRLITLALLLIVGQATAGEQLIDVQHDSVRGVTCWILNNTGISCLSDSSLQQTPASTATPSSEKGRASQASSTLETVPLTATPRLQKKGFQL